MTVRCGNCKGEHTNAAAVKECYITYKGERASERAMRVASKEDGWMTEPPSPEELQAERRPVATLPSVQTTMPDMPKARTPVPAHLRREDKAGGVQFTEIGTPNVLGPEVMLGRYAVILDGEQVTLRFHMPAIGKFKGIQLVKYLYGPDNTESGDWVTFANRDGDGYRVWGKFINSVRLLNALRHMMGADTDELIGCGEAYALASSNCWRCGRDLTVEESIIRGMGPVCAEKVFGE